MTTAGLLQPPASASLASPDYWWFEARARLMRVALLPFLPRGGTVLDVGSADGPSVEWIDEVARRVPLDINPVGVPAGGVCASALRLPLRADSLDVVTAFDVVEHFPAELPVLSEFRRVLRPGGALLLSVPAYQWAWSSFDVNAGHHRRYTARRISAALAAAGFEVLRVTYAFAATLPLFAVDRLLARAAGQQRAEVGTLPGWAEALLLRGARLDERVLRRRDLPFGSSVLVAARKA